MKIIPHKKTSHLGDLINILQTQDADEIVAESSTEEMLTFLMSVFPNGPKITHDTIEAKTVKPSWSKELPDRTESNVWFRGPYKKTNTKNQKKSHIACQFDARSFPPWPKSIKNTHKLLELFPNRLVNIGDKTIEGMKNKTECSLSEKFEILNSATAYIGIDSGLTHLALMTDVPVYVVHPEKYCPWIFYPVGPKYISEQSIHDILSRIAF